eukprot:6703203-Prymnesium_polylepis.1
MSVIRRGTNAQTGMLHPLLHPTLVPSLTRRVQACNIKLMSASCFPPSHVHAPPDPCPFPHPRSPSLQHQSDQCFMLPSFPTRPRRGIPLATCSYPIPKVTSRNDKKRLRDQAKYAIFAEAPLRLREAGSLHNAEVSVPAQHLC